MEGTAAPAEHSDSDDRVAINETTLSATIADTCSSLLDAVALIERIEAKQDAWKIDFIDQARRVAEISEHGLVAVGSSLSPRQKGEMVQRSFRAEVAGVLHIPEGTAGQLIDDSSALMHRLPASLAALRAGDISLRHARVIVDQTSSLDEQTAHALEAAVLPFAQTLTVSRFRQQARVIRERIDADSAIERTTRSAKDRRLEFVPAPDGMAWLSLYTTAPEARSLYAAVREAAMSLQRTDEARTVSQLVADVCADALAAGLAGERAAGPSTTAFGRIEPTVVVTVPAMTLLDVSDEPGDLAGYGPIDSDTARRLAGKSKTWLRLLTDPVSGAPLTLGRTRYKPTKRMREYLALRDGFCRFPGCSRRARHCEIDHTQAWLTVGEPTAATSHTCAPCTIG
ncbi:hypothetical protein IWX78_002191 [Mycetocola sp. CAN_C7]|uniref:HNH endonuclease signature motif containing protein n=1 Tax=Mycetocola sp. CAN_C7 TaxID=2787724 RepID=UPI0018CB36D7